jgi:hypothetical protein
VARNDRRPVTVEVPPINGDTPDDAASGGDWNGGAQPSTNADAFGQAVNMGVGLAGSVLEALTK